MSVACSTATMPTRPTPTTRAEREADRLELELRRAFALGLRRILDDTGITQAAFAATAHLSQAQLSRLLAAQESPSLHAVAALTTALGARAVVRIDPLSRPPIRDHLQARIAEACLRIVHVRWKRFLEVVVHRPVRGMVDTVLHDPVQAVVVAGEIHTEVRRWEQLLRWSREKADALLTGSELPLATTSTRPPRVSKLLILRSTAATRAFAREFEANLRTAYPAPSADAYAALTTATAPWPGNAVLWANVNGRTAEILAQPPRGIRVGR
jgi:hypothetical protein